VIRILIIDDHPAVRRGLSAALRTEPGFKIVATASTADEALAAVRRSPPDLALADYELPDGDGVSLAREFAEQRPAPRVVIYSAFASPRLSLAAALAGAHAVIDKAAPVETTLDALREVARGETCFHQLTPELLQASAAGIEPGDHAILGLALAGERPQEIARVLGRSPSEIDWRLGLIIERIRPRPTRTGASAS
jgi:DNA-binding NarL/FixJ family response regulator